MLDGAAPLATVTGESEAGAAAAASTLSVGNAADEVTPELQELALGLGYDPYALFFWVRDNIAFSHYYGIRKGAAATLLERSGNDADTAALLVALLRLCPTVSTAKYVQGFVSVPFNDTSTGKDINHWLGVDPVASLVDSVLTEHGTPVADVVKGFTTGGTLVAYAWRHWWVQVQLTSGGNAIWFDASFKTYNRTPAVNMVTAAQYSRSVLLSAASAGSVSTPHSVRNMNEAGLGTELSGRTNALLSYIRSNMPNANPTDITGGLVPVAGAEAGSGASVYFPLSVDTTQSPAPLPVYDALPSTLFSTMQVQAGSINVSLRLAELQGKTLWMEMGALSKLWLDESVIAQEAIAPNPASIDVVFSIDHAGGTFGDQTGPVQTVPRVGIRAVVYGMDGSQAALRRHQEKQETLALSNPAISPRLKAEAQAVVGYAWMHQTQSAGKLLADMAGIAGFYHHRLGFMADEYNTTTGEGGYYVDFPLQFTTASGRTTAVTAADTDTWLGTLAMIGSAMEHGVIAQQQGGQSAASTASLTAAGNLANGTTYLATNTNWLTSVYGALTHYQAADIAAIESAVTSTTGFALVPGDGLITIGSWQGAGYMTWKPTTTGGLNVGMKITGGYFGGYSGTSAPMNAYQAYDQFLQSSGRMNYAPVTQALHTGGDPVDMGSGQFTYDEIDLTLGDGSLPRGISFGRHYHGGKRQINPSGLGYGWNHSLHFTATERSDIEGALGGSSAQHAAAAIMGIYATWDVFKNRGTTPRNWVAAMLAAKWVADRLYNNSAVVNLADRVLEFQRLPDGTYLSPPGVTATLTKNGTGQFIVQERHGNTWTYNIDGTLAKVTDQWGREATFVWNATKKRVESVADCYGRSLTLAYSPISGRMTGVSDSTGRSVSFLVQVDGSLQSSTDVEGKTTTFEYDAQRRLTGMKNHAGEFLVQNSEFDSQDRVTAQISQGDAARVWRYYYAPGQTVEVNPLGERTTHIFDQRRRKTATVDALGNRTSYLHDGQDHIAQATTPLGNKKIAFFDGSHNPVTVYDALNHGSSCAYDGQNHLVSETDRNFKTTLYSDYNAQHQPQTVTAPSGVITTYTYVPASSPGAGGVHTVSVAGTLKSVSVYDSYDRPWKITTGTGADAGTVTFLYNTRGDLTSVEDSRGNITTYDHNLRRQLVDTFHPGSMPGDPDANIHHTYNDNRDLETTTTARNHTTTFRYTRLSKPWKTLFPDPGNPAQVTDYDLADRPTDTTDPTGIVITRELDALGRPWKVRNALFHTVETTFDDDGRITDVKNPLNFTTHTDYTNRNEVWKTTQPDGFFVEHSYDNEGRPLTLKNRTGTSWTYTYDNYGRANGLTSPTSRSTSWTYDSQGRILRRNEPSGQWTKLLYDSRDRVKGVEFYATSSATTPVGSLASTFDGNGNLLTLTEGSAVLTRTYDRRNAVATFTNALNETFLYRYDANGNLTRLTLPDGKILDYTYDSRDRLSTVTDWAARTTTLSWDAASRLTQVTRPNGTTRKLFYDAAGRFIRAEERKADGHLITLVRLGLDVAGRIDKRFVVPIPPGATAPVPNLTYTAENWISGYSHDADGNLLAIPVVPAVSTQPYGISLPQASPGIKLVHPSLSNATWDQRNRLTSLTLSPSGTVSFTYDAEGRRLTKTSSAGTTRYVHNPHGLSGLSEVTVEHRPGGSTRWYVWGGPAGLLYEERSDGTLRYYHTDQVGSVLALSDGTGAVTGRLDYTPYGLIAQRSGDTDTPFQFNGAYGVMWDEETGLIHMRARYYHPWLARFVSEDPIGFDGGLNLFAFANGSPISLLDASGLCADNFALYDWTTLLPKSPAGGHVELPTFERSHTQIMPSESSSRSAEDISGARYYGSLRGHMAEGASIAADLALAGASLPARTTTAVARGAAAAVRTGAPRNLNVYETIFEAPITGTTRGAHRASANRFLANQMGNDAGLAGMMNQELGTNVLQHMRSGKSLLNPPGTVWHHPIETPNVMRLLRVGEHTNPALQPVLHPGPNGIGGFGTFYGP